MIRPVSGKKARILPSSHPLISTDPEVENEVVQQWWSLNIELQGLVLEQETVRSPLEVSAIEVSVSSGDA